MTAERPMPGELWDAKSADATPVRVQIKSIQAGMVEHVFLTGPREGERDVQYANIFRLFYRYVDIEAECTPVVKPGETWWLKNADSPCSVKVLSVLSDVVTYRFNEDSNYAANDIPHFLKRYQPDKPERALPHYGECQDYIFVVASDEPTGDMHWSVPSPKQGFGVLRVPIRWDEATWEVEPS